MGSPCAFDPVSVPILTDGVWNETFDMVTDDAGTPEPIPVGTEIRVSLHLQPGPGQPADAPKAFSTLDGTVVVSDFDNGHWQMNADPNGWTPGKYAMEVRYFFPGGGLPEPSYRGVRAVIKGASVA